MRVYEPCGGMIDVRCVPRSRCQERYMIHAIYEAGMALDRDV